MQKLQKLIALITGANKGIGLEIARQLGRADVTVLLGARDAIRGENAANILRREGLDAHFVSLDVIDQPIIERAAAWVGEQFGKLDILVNNAGISDPEDGPPSNGKVEAARRLLETNFLGPLAVTQVLLPLLRKSASGRIVNMSSSLGSLTLNGDPASPYYAARLIGYNASKAALNMLTVQLSEELRDSKVIVNSACPGYVKTDLNGNTGYLSVPEAAAVPVRLALLRGDQREGRFVSADGEVPW